MEGFILHTKVECLLRQGEDLNILLETWLNEEQGLPSQILEMVDKILDSSFLERSWARVTTPETYRITFDMYPLVKDIKRNFIGPKSFLKITIYDPDKEMGDEGYYEGSNESELDPETGTLSKANIVLKISFPRGKSIKALRWFLRSSLSHELVHVFEDYNRRHLNRPTLFKAIADRGYSDPAEEGEKDPNLKYLTYVLDSAEQKAFIGEAVADVQSVLRELDRQGKLDRVRSFRTMDKFLQYSDFWGLYEQIRDWVEGTQWNRLPEYVQKKLVKQYNELVKGTGRAPKNYNDLVKKIQFRWSEFDKTLKTKVGQAVAKYLVPTKPKDPILKQSKLRESIFYQAY